MIRNTINKDPRKIKRQKFFAKYGISLALGGCVLVAVVVTIFTNGLAPKSDENQLAIESTPIPEFEYLENAPTAAPLLPDESLEQLSSDTTLDANDITSEASNDTIVKTESIVPDLLIPVNGNIVREYAKERLVYSPTLKEYSTHLAVDISGKPGQSVVASADGEVVLCGDDKLLGSYVIIKHNDRVSTGYYSLGSYNVKVGDTLAAGDVLGTVGASALLENSMGEHVHFELTVDNKNVSSVEHFVTK